MSNTKPVDEIFYIVFKDKKYPCKRMEQKGSIFFCIKFDTRILCLTKLASGGQLHWTAVPSEAKLNHIVYDLGAQIDKHYNI